MKIIKVLVVDDSLLYRKTIVDGISQHPNIEVVAVASNPYEARDCIIKHNPDVMTLDVEMPRMDGISFLAKLMPQYPMPVIMVSSVDNRVFEAMEYGAVDFVVKTNIASNKHLHSFIADLTEKIIIASESNITKKVLKTPAPTSNPTSSQRIDKTKLIVLGASTGGIGATETILTRLPNSIPPMLIIQHMPPEFTKMYADRLNKICKPRIKEAENGDVLETGTIYIAKGGFHMKILKHNESYILNLFEGEKLNGHIPSIDVTFHSVSKYFSKSCLAVILTGMGHDGAKGIRRLHDLGAYTIGQNKATSVVYGMPKVANDLGAIDIQSPIDSISDHILAHL